MHVAPSVFHRRWPAAIAGRRAAKKAEKQRRHIECLKQKKIRDAEYWALRENSEL